MSRGRRVLTRQPLPAASLPYRQARHISLGAAWDVDGVRDDARAYALEHLGGADGVLVSMRLGSPKGRQICCGATPTLG